MEAAPTVADAPAPWTLTGSGYVFLVRLPRAISDAALFTPPALCDKRIGRVAKLMVVDYESSNVGPYLELLVMPGAFQGEHGRFHSVTRIFVSTEESVVNGRKNWGIPKDIADFSWKKGAPRREDIIVSRGGNAFAEISAESYGPSLPMWSGLLPPAQRTLRQPWEGKNYEVKLGARGLVRRSGASLAVRSGALSGSCSG
jgi:hypothetical protein